MKRPFLVVFALVVVACRKREEPASNLSTTASPVKIDALKKGEIPEGKDELFGLRLPLDTRVHRKLGDFASATIPRYTLEEVCNYLRDRIAESDTSVGAARTVFSNVKLKGKPGKILQIAVWRSDTQVSMEVQDTTPPPKPTYPPGTTDEEIWRRNGYTKDGKPLNPSAMD
ncbi:MAG: hypothetical protein KBF88_13825 [Polyangiaceae bacterium]|nr:hypothetical protein [Polyangiaceae bacterium]